jgi:LysR family transcriptional regulator of gallate degradation
MSILHAFARYERVIGNGVSFDERSMKPSYPNLRNLVRMLRVIEAGGLTAVAHAVGRSQQTISHAIRDLEQELGVQLFERTSHGTYPTPQAVIVGHRVRNALAHLSEAQDLFFKNSRDVGRARGLRFCEFNVSNQHVLIFVALCDQHEAKRVAMQLDVDVSAVRKALRSLEAQIGRPMFEKASRGLLIPSEFADFLAKQTKRALWEIRAGIAELRSAEGVIQGEVVFGASPRAHPTLLPRIISRLRRKYPTLTLTHRVDSYDGLTKALSSREADFIVGTERAYTFSPDIAAHPLLEDRIGILARVGHPLARIPRPEIRQYLRCEWILPPRHVPTRRHFNDCLRREDLPEPAAILECGSYELLRGVLLETDTVALALRCEALHDIEQGVLCFLPRPDALAALFDSPVILHLTCPLDITRSPSAQAFFEEANGAAAELQKDLRAATAGMCPHEEFDSRRQERSGEPLLRERARTKAC